jgi:HD-GYP domain-containing protein (c-di-GMP phosphodiesterase class II)
VKQHVRIGIEILRPLQQLDNVLGFIHDHHEHWDGSGYPRGIRGENITLGGRILAGADAFDALTSQRAYRDPMRADDSLAYLGTVAGALLDPQVVRALQIVMKRRLAAA